MFIHKCNPALYTQVFCLNFNRWATGKEKSWISPGWKTFLIINTPSTEHRYLGQKSIQQKKNKTKWIVFNSWVWIISLWWYHISHNYFLVLSIEAILLWAETNTRQLLETAGSFNHSNFEKGDHIMHIPEYDVNISRLGRVSL